MRVSRWAVFGAETDAKRAGDGCCRDGGRVLALLANRTFPRAGASGLRARLSKGVGATSRRSKWRRTLSFLAACLAFGGAAAAQTEAAPPERPRPTLDGVIIERVFQGSKTSAGDRIALPAGPVEATVSKYSIPANATLPEHRHPFPRYGYVLAGSLEVINLEAGTVRTFEPGSFIVEDVERWHKARTVGAVPVELLVIDFAPLGQSNTVLRGADAP